MVTNITDTADGGLTPWWNAYMNERETAETEHLQLFVRSLRPSPGAHRQRQRIVEGIQAVYNQNTIDSFDVTVVGEQLCLCEWCREAALDVTIYDSIQKLATWEYDEVSSCGFTQRSVDSWITNETYSVIAPPERALGVYLDGALAGVFPCAIDGTQYGIETFLRALVEDQPLAETATPSRQTNRLRSPVDPFA